MSRPAIARAACSTTLFPWLPENRHDGRACAARGALQPLYNLVVNAMDLGGEVLVSELRSTVAGDDIAIGSVADRCLLSGVIQTSHFKGVRTVFDPQRSLHSRITERSSVAAGGPMQRPQ
jgi:hypothetical protein